MHRINIILPVMGGKSWTGGITYISNLIDALITRDDIRVILVNNLDEIKDSSGKEGKLNILASPLFRALNSIRYKFSMLLYGYNRKLNRKLEKFKGDRLNVIFTNNQAHLYAGNELIKLYWIPDFQHLHLPELFTEQQLEERNQKFRRGIRQADIIILSSRDALKDLKNFEPDYADKCRISNFVANVPSGIWESDPAYLMQKYGIPSKFFYLPNQFWRHKNHELVFQALHKLKNEGIEATVVCTGNLTDYRYKEHYQELEKKIVRLGLQGQVHILGLVEHSDVYMLIRQSIAVLNPSLFEGWSTTVEECKSIGKQCILSDIDVHKEQNPPKVTYFKRNDPTDLAEKMKNCWTNSQEGPDIELENSAKAIIDSRKSEYANNFISIIREFEKQKNDSKRFHVPILFLIFNRPKLTKQSLDKLRQIKPRVLYVAADGPRKNNEEDISLCRQTRELIEEIDWECEIHKLYRDENLSTQVAVSSAITWFFKSVKEGIILEDDCIADADFFRFSAQMLEKYRDDHSIFHINGSNYIQRKKFNFEGSYYFSRLCHPWGWASWSRAWKYFDYNMNEFQAQYNAGLLNEIFQEQDHRKYFSNQLLKTYAGNINSWAYRWYYSVWKNKGKAIKPVENMVS
ncbi:MAG: glycosyltransferase, partial [Bacteroidetes bacterium]